MTIKTLENWRKIWNVSEETPVKKVQKLLQQYVDDSETGVAGFTYPIDWYVTSGGKNVRYLSSEPVEKTLGRVTFDDDDDDVEVLLRQVKKDLIYFYTMKFQEMNDHPQGDELLDIFQVINENTGVDCLTIDLTREEEIACVFSHG